MTAEARAILDNKGRGELGPVAENANAIPVRRVLTLAAAFSRKPLAQSRILDLACQEGCYGIEAALAGATVVGVEARADHVARANVCIDAAGVRDRVAIEESDVRAVTAEARGRFDIVFLLGILYHLDDRDAIETLKRIAGLCDDLLIIDTHVALASKETFDFEGESYEGAYVREHGANDATAEKLKRGQASIDNEFAFYFTKPSLVRLLTEVGFPVVVEASAPADATKPADRATFVALKRPLHEVRIYPWVAGLSEAEIAVRARPNLPREPGGARAALSRLANRLLHPLGFDLRRK